MSACYLYEILVDAVVRYVGMGRGDRIYVHNRIARRIIRKSDLGLPVTAQLVHLNLADSIRRGAAITSRIVYSTLSAHAARELEVSHIASFEKDQLWNRHPGGGGASPERMAELWADPAWRARQIAALQSSWDNTTHRAYMAEIRSAPEFKEKIRSAVTARFADPEERARQSQRTAGFYAANPGAGREHGNHIKTLWADPLNHERFSRAVTAHWDDPQHRARQSEAAKQQWSDPDGRAKLMAAAKEKWTPELRAWRSQKTKEQFRSPEARERAREAIRARWADPEQRAKMSAAIRAGKQRKRLSSQKLPQDPVS